MSLPKELKLRADRLAAMAVAKAKIAARAAERYAREKAEFDEKMSKREARQIVPLIAVARQDHHPHWSERFTEPAPLKADATPMQAMAHRLTTKAGTAAYGIRKQTVEPVFGIIKSVMGFRQFSLRGLRKVTGEWNPVCLAWNVKRMAVLRPKIG
jgi:hypothetical protein